MMRRLFRLLCGLTLATSIILVSVVMIQELPTKGQYILTFGTFIGCYLSIAWGMKGWSKKAQ